MCQIILETVLCEFSFDGISRTADADSLRISTLYHEAFYDTMEDNFVIEALLYERDEVVYSIRCNVRIKLSFHDITIFHSNSNYRICQLYHSFLH